MAETTISNRDKLLKRKAQIEARLRDIDARQQKQKRVDDTRTKILYGSNAMILAKENPEFAKAMDRQLDRGLTRAIDRKLFGLPALEPEKQDGESDAENGANQPETDRLHASPRAEGAGWVMVETSGKQAL